MTFSRISVALFAIILAVRAQSDPCAPTCTQDNNGEYIAHPSDCTLFYLCSNGQALLNECPGDLYFSPSLGVCDQPENANCVADPNIDCGSVKPGDTTTSISFSTTTKKPEITTSFVPQTTTRVPEITTTRFVPPTTTREPEITTTRFVPPTTTREPEITTTRYVPPTTSREPEITTTRFVPPTTTREPEITTTRFIPPTTTREPEITTTRYIPQTTTRVPEITTTRYVPQTTTRVPEITTTRYVPQTTTRGPEVSTKYSTGSHSSVRPDTTTSNSGLAPCAPTCTQDNNGEYFTHPSDCSLFYLCSNGQALLNECPGDLYFSPSLGVCDQPENANCVADPGYECQTRFY